LWVTKGPFPCKGVKKALKKRGGKRAQQARERRGKKEKKTNVSVNEKGVVKGNRWRKQQRGEGKALSLKR